MACQMTLDNFNVNWRRLFLIDDFCGKEIKLISFLKGSLGRHGGGVLFIGSNEEEGNLVILKCDENDNCYKRIGDTGDDEKDWEWIGILINPSGLP